MKSLTNFLLVVLLVAVRGARADADADRLERALAILRNRVYASYETPEGRMFLWGSIGAGFGTVFTTIAGVGLVAVRPPIARWAYGATAASAVLTTGAYLTAWRGLHRIRHDPTPPPPPGPSGRDQTPEGLREFLRLTTDEQRRLAHDHPDFAAFLIEVAGAYQRVIDAQFLPEVNP